MFNTAEFQAKLNAIHQAMERDEWAKATQALENFGGIPEKFHAITNNILFYLYISRNQFEKLAKLSDRLDPAKPKDSVAALLLLRDKKIEYPIDLPRGWKLDIWEEAVEKHAKAGNLDPTELQLCLYLLSYLERPKLLGLLHSLSVEAGGKLDDESIEVVLRCYLRSRWFEEARRLVWFNNLNGISFERFTFLIDRAEKVATHVPESNDKALQFFRYKFGDQFPAENSTS